MSGRLILMGSGEMAPGLVATHRAGLEAASTDEVLILDTPFGFQENADQLTQRIVEFFETSLRARPDVASLRSVAASTVERERFLAKLSIARYVFTGPGSPSYALRVWEDVGAAAALAAVVKRGGTLTVASAASLTLGRATIPVYEIYKVGEDPRWLQGMDIMSRLGLPCTVVPHWNNTEGGNHDTSRCYIGQRRFASIVGDLDTGVLGVDEHTAATVDFAAEKIAVTGRGSVTLCGTSDLVVESGDSVPLAKAAEMLGGGRPSVSEAPPSSAPELGFDEAITHRDGEALLTAVLEAERRADQSNASSAERQTYRTMLVRLVEVAESGLVDPRDAVGGFVDLLIGFREAARTEGRYADADDIRDRLADLGVEIRDTASGSEWVLSEDR